MQDGSVFNKGNKTEDLFYFLKMSGVLSENTPLDTFKDNITDSNYRNLVFNRFKAIHGDRATEDFLGKDTNELTLRYKYADIKPFDAAGAAVGPTFDEKFAKTLEQSLKTEKAEKKLEDKLKEIKPNNPIAKTTEVVNGESLQTSDLEGISKEEPKGRIERAGNAFITAIEAIGDLLLMTSEVLSGKPIVPGTRAYNFKEGVLNYLTNTTSIVKETVQGDYTTFKANQKAIDSVLQKDLSQLSKIINNLPEDGKEEIKKIIGEDSYNAVINNDVKGFQNVGRFITKISRDLAKLGLVTGALPELIGDFSPADLLGNEKLKKAVESKGIDYNQFVNLVDAVNISLYKKDHSPVEFLVRQAVNVFGISRMLSRGYKDVKGLSLRTAVTEEKLLKKLGPEAKILSESESAPIVKKLNLPEKSKVAVSKEGEVIGLVDKSRTYNIQKFIETGNKSFRYHVPRIMNEIAQEKQEMDVRGVTIEPGFYSTELFTKSFEAYMDNLGEYVGTRLDPVTDPFVSKIISNRTARTLANHFVINNLSEMLEERVTDVFTQYLPAIIMGETPETLESLKQKLVTEFITFLPLGITGYSIQKSIESKVENLEKKKQELLKKTKEAAEKRESQINQLALNSLISSLEKLQDGENLTEEEAKVFQEYKQKGLEAVINDLTSEETLKEVQTALEKQKKPEKLPSVDDTFTELSKEVKNLEIGSKDNLINEFAELKKSFNEQKESGDALVINEKVEKLNEYLFNLFESQQITKSQFEKLSEKLSVLYQINSKNVLNKEVIEKNLFEKAQTFFTSLYGEGYNPTSDDINLFSFAILEYSTEEGKQLKNAATKILAQKAYERFNSLSEKIQTDEILKEKREDIKTKLFKQFGGKVLKGEDLVDTENIVYSYLDDPSDQKKTEIKGVFERYEAKEDLTDADVEKMKSYIDKNEYIPAGYKAKFKGYVETVKKMKDIDKKFKEIPKGELKANFIFEEADKLSRQGVPTEIITLIKGHAAYDFYKSVTDEKWLDKVTTLPYSDAFGKFMMKSYNQMKKKAKEQFEQAEAEAVKEKFKKEIDDMPDYSAKMDITKGSTHLTSAFMKIFPVNIQKEKEKKGHLEGLYAGLKFTTDNTDDAEYIKKYFADKLGIQGVKVITGDKKDKGKFFIYVPIGTGDNAKLAYKAVLDNELELLYTGVITIDNFDNPDIFNVEFAGRKIVSESLAKIQKLEKEIEILKKKQKEFENKNKIDQVKQVKGMVEMYENELKLMKEKYSNILNDIDSYRLSEYEYLSEERKKYRQSLMAKTNKELKEILKKKTIALAELKNKNSEHIPDSEKSNIDSSLARMIKFMKSKVSNKSESKRGLTEDILLTEKLIESVNKTIEESKKHNVKYPKDEENKKSFKRTSRRVSTIDTSDQDDIVFNKDIDKEASEFDVNEWLKDFAELKVEDTALKKSAINKFKKFSKEQQKQIIDKLKERKGKGYTVTISELEKVIGKEEKKKTTTSEKITLPEGITKEEHDNAYIVYTKFSIGEKVDPKELEKALAIIEKVKKSRELGGKTGKEIRQTSKQKTSNEKVVLPPDVSEKEYRQMQQIFQRNALDMATEEEMAWAQALKKKIDKYRESLNTEEENKPENKPEKKTKKGPENVNDRISKINLDELSVEQLEEISQHIPDDKYSKGEKKFKFLFTSWGTKYNAGEIINKSFKVTSFKLVDVYDKFQKGLKNKLYKFVLELVNKAMPELRIISYSDLTASADNEAVNDFRNHLSTEYNSDIKQYLEGFNKTINPSKFIAKFDRQNKVIVYNDQARISLPIGIVLIHEFAHGITTEAIKRSFNSDKVLFRKILKFQQSILPKLKTLLEGSTYTTSGRINALELSEDENENITPVTEFIADALSNAEIVEALNLIEYENNTALGKIGEFIKEAFAYIGKILGFETINENSALSYLNGLVDEIITNTLEKNNIPIISDIDDFALENQQSMMQLSSLMEKADAELDKTILRFLNNINVTVEQVNNIKTATGLSPIAISDILNKMVYVSKNRSKIDTLPEEAAHFFIEFLPRDSQLYADLLGNITSWEGYEEVYNQYKDEYRDTLRIAKEAAAKFIAQEIVKKYKRSKQNKLLKIADKVVNFVLDLFKNKKYDHFKIISDIADDILNNNISKLPVKYRNYEELKTFEEALQNNPAAAEVYDKLTEAGFIPTGSLEIRKYGTIYRPKNEDVHDLDFIAPSGMYIENAFNLIKTVLPDARLLNFPKSPSTVQPLRTFSIIQFSYEFNNKKITFDVFFNTEVSLPIWAQTFKAKLSMRREKDVFDLINFKLYNPKRDKAAIREHIYYQLEEKKPKVEVYKGFWTREEVANQPDKIFLFGDNTKDRTETKHVPTSTQAVIRGLPNTIGIDTKKDRETDPKSYLSDDDFEWFKNHLDNQIQLAISSGKTVVIPADGIGTGKAKLKEKAPKLYEYLRQQFLEKFGFDNDTGQIVKETTTPEYATAVQKTGLFAEGIYKVIKSLAQTILEEFRSKNPNPTVSEAFAAFEEAFIEKKNIIRIAERVKEITKEPYKNLLQLVALEMFLNAYDIVPAVKGSIRLSNFENADDLIDTLLKYSAKVEEPVSESVTADKEEVETPVNQSEMNNEKDTDPQLLEQLPVTIESPEQELIKEALADEVIETLIETQEFVRALGVVLARLKRDLSFLNLFKKVKVTNMTYQQFIDYFSGNTKESQAIDDILKNVWQVKFSKFSRDYDTWKQSALTRIYNMIKYRNHEPHIGVSIKYEEAYSSESKKIESKPVMKISFGSSNKFIDAEGNSISTIMNETMLKIYAKILKKLFGNLEIHFVGSFDSEIEEEYDAMGTLVNLFYNHNYFYIGKFADKSEMPVFKFNTKTIESNTPLILSIYNRYAQLSGVTPTEMSARQKIVQTFAYLIYELSNGGNVEKIMTGQFDIQDSALLSKTIKDGQYKAGSIFKILKRVPFLTQRKIGTEEAVIDKYKITDDPKTSGVNGVFYKVVDGVKKLYFNQLTVRTDLEDNKPHFITVDGQQYDLKKLLFNNFGTEITDGLSITLYAKNGFNDLYNDYIGELKKGTIKNSVFNEPGDNPIYLKHSVQYVNSDDIIGRWMVQHNIAMLSFQSALKIGQASTTLDDFQNEEAQIIPRAVPFKYISHGQIKGKIQKRVKALRQLITSSYLSSFFKALPSSSDLMKSLNTIVSENMNLKLADFTNEFSIENMFKMFQDIVKSPNSYAQNNIAKTFPQFSNITLDEFKANFKFIIKHPAFAYYLNDIMTKYFESIFSIELSQGSALVLLADLGVLTGSRLEKVRQNIKNLGLNESDVLDENGRLKEGYCILSSNYAREKNVKIGDSIVHSVIPTDSPLAINSSKVIAILNESYIPQGGIILNSEYIQSIVGKDFDIDVMYAFNFDEKIMDHKQWEKFNQQIKDLQKEFRTVYTETVRDVIKDHPVIRNNLAEKLGFKPDSFEINSLEIAINKETQLAFMQALYGVKEAGLINPFVGINLIKLTSLSKKLIGKEVQFRTYFSTNLAVGLKFYLPLGGKQILFDPTKSYSTVNTIKHTIATNDTVDLPNRENYFFYNYNDTLDILSDYLGMDRASELITRDKEGAEELANSVLLINQLLWEDYIQISRGREQFKNINKNINTYARRLLRQQNINEALMYKDYEGLRKILLEKVKLRHSYFYSGQLRQSQNKKEIERETNIVNSFIDGLKAAMADDTVQIKEHPLLKAISDFNIGKLYNIALSVNQYRNIEKSVVRILLTKYTGTNYLDQEDIDLEEAVEKVDYKNQQEGRYEKDLLSQVMYRLFAAMRFQGETDKVLQFETKYGKGRRAVMPYILRYLFSKEDLHFSSTNVDRTRITNLLYEKDGKSVAAEFYMRVINNELYMGLYDVIGKTIIGEVSLKEFLDIIPPKSREVYKFLKDNIYDKNFWSAERRRELTKIIPFADVKDKETGEVLQIGNLTYGDGRAIAVQILRDAQASGLFTQSEIRLLELSMLSGKRTSSVNIGNLRDPQRALEIYGEKKSIVEAVDYGNTSAILSVTGAFDPGFNEEYFKTFNEVISSYSVTDPFKELDLDNYETNILTESEHIGSGNTKNVLEKSFRFYNNKYAYEQISESSAKLLINFTKKLITSPLEAYKMIQDMIVNLSFLQAYSMESPDGITNLIKDIKKLDYNKFVSKYSNVNIDENVLSYTEAILTEKYNITPQTKEIANSKARKKLLAAFLLLLGIKNSYVKNYLYLPNKIKQSIFSIEMYAIKNGAKVYWDYDENDVIDVIPVFNLDIDKYTVRKYAKKHIQSNMYEYYNAYRQDTPSLVDEAFYRIDRLDMYIRKLDNELNQKLGEVAAIVRRAAKELNNNKAYKLKHDVSAHINRNAYDIAEKFFVANDIQIKKVNDKYYFIYKGEYYTIETEGNNISLADKLYPEIKIPDDIKPNTSEYLEYLEERANREIIRASLKAAMHIRIILDYDTKAIVSNIKSYVDSIKKLAGKTGNRDLEIILNKISEQYLRFYSSMFTRQYSYMPRYWTKANYLQQYKEFIRRKFIENYTANNPEATEKEIEEELEKYVKKELAFIRNDGFGMAFNPNAKMRTLPDWFSGYEKDIFFSMNNYLNNLKAMMTEDVAKAEYILYMLKAREYGENPYVIDTMKKFYARKAQRGDMRTVTLGKDDIKIGQKIEFWANDGNSEVMKAGRVSNIKEEYVELENYDGEKQRFYFNDISIYDDLGHQIKGKVKKYIETGVIEKFREYTEELKYRDSKMKYLWVPVQWTLEKMLGRINYALTMTILGTIAQLPAVVLQWVGGTVMNLYRNPIQNVRYIKSLKDFKDQYPEEYEEILAMLGIKSNDFLMDMATYADIGMNKLGVNESFVGFVKEALKNIGTNIGLTNKELKQYQKEIKELKAQYEKNPSEKLRKQMYYATISYYNKMFEVGYLTREEYKAKERKINKIYKDYTEKLPVAEEGFKYISTMTEFKLLYDYLSKKFNQSYLGLKLFQSPERALRIHSFIIGFRRADKILGGTDHRLAVEYGLSFVKAKQKYYGSIHKQLGAMTKLGTLIFKFAQFTYDEVLRERKNIDAAFRTFLLGNFSLGSYITETVKDEQGNKQKVIISENSFRQYLTGMIVSSILMNLSILFTGLENMGNPVKDWQLKFLKLLLKILNKEDIKLDYETASFIRSTIAVSGFGYGFGLIPNLVMYEESTELQQGRHPLIPRAYSVFADLYEALDKLVLSDELEYYDKYEKDTEVKRLLRKAERRLTGLNIYGKSYDERFMYKDMEGFDKLRELYKNPQDYFIPYNQEVKKFSELFK